MIDRLILSAVLGTVGWINLFPAEPPPMTSHQLRVKAIHESKSGICKTKKRTKALKELCERRQRRGS
jgi:hypothetical protein